MKSTINDGGKLWSVSFLTASNELLDRIVLAKPDSSYEEIEKTFLAKFPFAKQIKHIDEWDSVIVLNF